MKKDYTDTDDNIFCGFMAVIVLYPAFMLVGLSTLIRLLFLPFTIYRAKKTDKDVHIKEYFFINGTNGRTNKLFGIAHICAIIFDIFMIIQIIIQNFGNCYIIGSLFEKKEYIQYFNGVVTYYEVYGDWLDEVTEPCIVEIEKNFEKDFDEDNYETYSYYYINEIFLINSNSIINLNTDFKDEYYADDFKETISIDKSKLCNFAKLRLQGGVADFKKPINDNVKEYYDRLKDSDNYVYYTSQGKKYHNLFCDTLKNTYTLKYSTLDKLSNDYSPCSVCNPPQ